MRGKLDRGVAGGVVCAICALSLVPAIAQAAPTTQAVTERPDAVTAYWTGARMRHAKPAGALAPSPLLGGRALASPAHLAKRSSLHQRVTKTSSFPHRTEGKVFFTLPGGPPNGGDYECSATAVRSASRSLVWTAGHCVYDPGLLGAGYATNWEFVPAYNAGRKPYGEWPAATLSTTRQWHGTSTLSGGDSAFDFGAATVVPRGGKLLQNRIGARRIVFNQPRNLIYDAFGYPAESPPPEFDGRHLFRCRSPFRGSDTSVGPPPSIRISCDMTSGASGGGWVIRRGDRWYVASVTSYGYTDDRYHFYGPYQGNVARNLRESAGG